jgi:hypothetical protein
MKDDERDEAKETLDEHDGNNERNNGKVTIVRRNQQATCHSQKTFIRGAWEKGMEGNRPEEIDRIRTSSMSVTWPSARRVP